jgi:hypothetical protein
LKEKQLDNWCISRVSQPPSIWRQHTLGSKTLWAGEKSSPRRLQTHCYLIYKTPVAEKRRAFSFFYYLLSTSPDKNIFYEAGKNPSVEFIHSPIYTASWLHVERQGKRIVDYILFPDVCIERVNTIQQRLDRFGTIRVFIGTRVLFIFQRFEDLSDWCSFVNPVYKTCMMSSHEGIFQIDAAPPLAGSHGE